MERKPEINIVNLPLGLESLQLCFVVLYNCPVIHRTFGLIVVYYYSL